MIRELKERDDPVQFTFYELKRFTDKPCTQKCLLEYPSTQQSIACPKASDTAATEINAYINMCFTSLASDASATELLLTIRSGLIPPFPIWRDRYGAFAYIKLFFLPRFILRKKGISFLHWRGLLTLPAPGTLGGTQQALLNGLCVGPEVNKISSFVHQRPSHVWSEYPQVKIVYCIS